MFIDTDFILGGQLLSDYGLMVVSVDESGLKQIPFGINQNIKEERIKNKLYLTDVEEEPLSFEVKLALDPQSGIKWDFETRNKIIRWLFKKEYQLLESPDNRDICLYVIAVGDSKRFDNSLGDGYASITFRCNASHAWAYPAMSEYDLSNNDTEKIIEIENSSNIVDYYYPEMQIEMKGSTSISFCNLSNNGTTLTFDNLQDREEIYVNNASKLILSSLGENVYRINNCNKQWLNLRWGVNRIKVIGKAIVTFRTQFPVGI